jgi:hypothetical protein
MLVRIAVAIMVCAIAAPAVLRSQNRPIDLERSTLTVFVYKSGLFSVLADDHVIRAPLAGGMISEDSPLGVGISVHSAGLVVLDPGLSVEKRADVQARMLGPEVLDSARFPDIEFASTAIERLRADAWNVSGRVTIHGVTRSARFEVARQDGHYRGSTRVKLRDFRIEPISIAGGTVKVKDELKIEFDIVPAERSR